MPDLLNLEYKAAALAATLPGPVDDLGPEVTTEAVEPDEKGIVEALVAVTGVPDRVDDVIVPGAFARTLKSRPRPKVCLGHDWNRPIGKTLEIKELLPGDPALPKETADGRPWPKAAGALWARFLVDLGSDDGKRAYAAAKFFGGEATYSIGYKTRKARHVKALRYIDDLELYEYSQVLNPANDLATQQSVKAAIDDKVTEISWSTVDEMEIKARRYVRDMEYWGYPVGTPITPAMHPKGSKADKLRDEGHTPSRTVGTTEAKPPTTHQVDDSTGDQPASRVVPSGGGPATSSTAYRDPASMPQDATDRELAEARDYLKRVRQYHQEQTAQGKPGISPKVLKLAEDNVALWEDAKAKRSRDHGDDTPALVDDKNGDRWVKQPTGKYAHAGTGEERDHADIPGAVPAVGEDDTPALLDDSDGNRWVKQPTGKYANAQGDTQTYGQIAARGTVTDAEGNPDKAPAPFEPETITGPDGRTWHKEPSGKYRDPVTGDQRDADLAKLTTNGLVAMDPKKATKLLSKLDTSELEAHDKELADRARQLGKPGQLSPLHRAIKDEIATRSGEDIPDRSTAAQWRRMPGKAAAYLAPEQRKEYDKLGKDGQAIYRQQRGEDKPHAEAVTATRDALERTKTGDEKPSTPDGRTGNIGGDASTGQPYTVVQAPTRANRGTAIVDYNGTQYTVTASGGVLASVTVTADDGRSVTKRGGSTTMLRSHARADRERAVRDALAEIDAQKPGDNGPGREQAPETPASAPTATVPAAEVDQAVSGIDEATGLTEEPDGTLTVDTETAKRQDRVEKLLADADSGGFDVTAKTTPELTSTRKDLADELALQNAIARRGPSAAAQARKREKPAGQAAQRPGLAGAAEDHAEALRSGDTGEIARTRARLESSLRRSRAGSASAQALAEHVSASEANNPERLARLATELRTETRQRRAAQAKRRRTAKRLERERISSLLGQVDAELRTRQQREDEADRQRADTDYDAHVANIKETIDKAFSEGKATDRAYTVDGDGAVWQPERAAQHKDILDTLWNKLAPDAGNDGEAVIAGGLGGAGKSTVLRGPAGLDTSRYITVNPDDMKEEMAARGMIPDIPGLSPMEASALVHEESSYLANLLAARAYRERKNIIWDITMSRRGSVEKRITEMRAAGYTDIRAVFVDIPVETSVERALARHRRGYEKFQAGQGKGGRFVPPELIRANSSDVTSSANREVFDGLRDEFNSWSVYDNSVRGRDPQLVDHGSGNLTSRVNSDNVGGVGAAPFAEPGTTRPAADHLRTASDDELAVLLGAHADDDATIEAILAEMEARQADQDIADMVAGDPAWTRFEELLRQGMGEQDAAEEAFGVSTQDQQRERALALLRGQGYTGDRFEDIARKAYRDQVALAYRDAEDATRGHLLTPEGQRAGINPGELFSGPEARARRWASDELKQWWDEHGRESFADFKARLLGGHAAYRGSEGAFLT